MNTHTHTYTKRHAAVRKGIRFGIYLQFEYTHQLEAHSHILNEIRFYDKLIGSLLILSKMHWNNQRIPCRVIRWHTHTQQKHTCIITCRSIWQREKINTSPQHIQKYSPTVSIFASTLEHWKVNKSHFMLN